MKECIQVVAGSKQNKKKTNKQRKKGEEVNKIKSSSLPPGYISYVRGSRITYVSE
jgi:hypothetical protein